MHTFATVTAVLVVAVTAVLDASILVSATRWYRQRQLTGSCTWCSEQSGHPVRGHSTSHCKGYMREARDSTRNGGLNPADGAWKRS